ncbi:MAG: elongation factor G [Acetobacteraceae bacterium]|nr:elongation factor G [Acetobacteraceae bacterium]
MPDSLPRSMGARPRVVALAGPYGSGKSTLMDALLAAAGGPAVRLEKGGRASTTGIRAASCTFMGDSWTLLDCPGSVEFFHEAQSAMMIADLVVVVCEPAPEKAPAVGPLLRALHGAGVPHVLFINKIDTFTGQVREVIAALQALSRQPLVLRQVPIREGESITGYVDLASERGYQYRRGEASQMIAVPAHMMEREKEARGALLEALADHDDALLEKLLEDVVPTTEEIYRQLHKDVVEGAIVPVLLGAGEAGHGLRRLWKALRHDAPDPADTAARHGLPADGSGPLLQVFKTVHAGHAGKLSYARVWRGEVGDGAVLNGQRVAGLYRFENGTPVKTASAGPGEVVGLGRLDGIATGATIGGAALPWPEPPAPVYGLAIATDDRKDDVKLHGALQRLVEEDPCITVVHDPEMGVTVLRGQGEMHLGAAVERLSKVGGLKVSVAAPPVPFRETIKRAVTQHARLKRQTGGHGQFADVTLEISPRARGEGFRFSDRIVGGAVPKQYIPAVGEAAEAALAKGPLGQRVVDVDVVLVNGTFHAVDSSDMAFKTATRMAMQEGLAKADPVMLEPIDKVTISVPNEYTASAQRLITGRRGRILGYAERSDWPGWDDVEAQIPQAELQNLIIDLRSLTMGLGTYRHQFDHLAETQLRAAA